METIYIGPFAPADIDTIRRALEAQADNLEDFLDHGMIPGEDDTIHYQEEKARIGRIVDKLDDIKLTR